MDGIEVKGGFNTINGIYTGNYASLKNKFKIKIDESFYLSYIDSVTSQMFYWDEKIYRPELLDRMVRDAGVGALVETTLSKYTPVWFMPTGDLMPDGWLKDCKCFDFAGKEYEFKDWRNNPEVLVFFNTPLRMPDQFNGKFADMLTNVDFSIVNNVHYSRQHPVPVVRDRKTKNQVDAVIRDVSNGNFNTVLVEQSIKDILENDDEIGMLNLTDVEKSQYIQYLSHLHDSLISRLYFLLGLGTTDNGKQAQITTEELNKNDDASITMALAWYKARKDSIDEASKKGHELRFGFTELWQNRIDRILAESEENEQSEEVESTPTEEGDEDDSENSTE